MKYLLHSNMNIEWTAKSNVKLYFPHVCIIDSKQLFVSLRNLFLQNVTTLLEVRSLFSDEFNEYFKATGNILKEI